MSFDLNQFAGGVSELLLGTKFLRFGQAVVDPCNHLGADTVKEQLGISGMVVDLAGNPLADVAVHVEYLGPRQRLSRRAGKDRVRCDAITDEHGEFRIQPLPAGRYRISPGVSLREVASAGRTESSPTAAFLPREIFLHQTGLAEPLILQAVPHVVIEARFIDSQGRPRIGPSPILSGRTHGDYFLTCCTVDRGGRVRALVPRGLQDVCLQISANGYSAVRHRLGNNQPLRDEREIELGVVSEDVRGIELVCYDAPSVSIRVAFSDEPLVDPGLPDDLVLAAMYTSPALSRVKTFTVKRGVYSHIWFEQNPDGNFRSKDLLPDEPFLVTAHAAGYHSSSATICLGEGEQVEAILRLEKGV